MPRLKPATRIAITLGFISATIVWIAHGLNLIPSPNAHVHEKRLAIVRTLAGSVSGLASNGNSSNHSDLERSLELAARLNKDVLSAGVRGKSRYFAKSKNHKANWQPMESDDQPNQAELEVFSNKRLWGTLEVCFSDKGSSGLLGFMFPLSIVAFVSTLTTGFSWWILNRSFRYLNPSKVVPKRVRSAFDTLTEGLVLIDGDYEIAHANKAFEEILNLKTDNDSLLGTSLNDLGWKTQVDSTQVKNGVSAELPWFQCIDKEASVTGRILEIGEGDKRRKFFVNSAPIFGNKNDCRGAMISFDDVTEMEQKKVELAALVKTLRSSRDEVERQNEQLTFLASYDPLTECMNRRAFWLEFEKMWTNAQPDELSLLMIDVDHFKSFNDTYGHSFGDLVLKQLGETLRNTVPDSGLVSRFGGEEFVVALADMSIEEALELTNTIHKKIQEMDIEGKRVTASIGFSNRQFKAMDGQHMLDQADITLYAAKRGGRNRVMRFDECEANDDLEIGGGGADADQSEQDSAISKVGVASLFKAVEYRCEASADHSLRVSTLCAGIGESFLEPIDVYRLKVAAQLHEIGKLGVSDSILNETNDLGEEDLQIIQRQKQIGLQLLRSVLPESVVPQIIEGHQNITDQDNSNGESNSINATLETSVAILAICDEFDSLTHDSGSRKALSLEDAIATIRNKSQTQFRSDIMGKFEAYVDSVAAELRLSRAVSMGASWPPKLSTQVEEETPASENAAPVSEGAAQASEGVAAVDIAKKTAVEEAVATNAAATRTSLRSAIRAPENSVETSLDLEISSTIKLANELLGLSEETRSVTAGESKRPKVVDQEKSREPS